MKYSAALRECRLGSADIETAIELRRVAGQHFPAEFFGQPDAERGLPRCRRPNHGNQRQFR